MEYSTVCQQGATGCTVKELYIYDFLLGLHSRHLWFSGCGSFSCWLRFRRTVWDGRVSFCFHFWISINLSVYSVNTFSFQEFIPSASSWGGHAVVAWISYRRKGGRMGGIRSVGWQLGVRYFWRPLKNAYARDRLSWLTDGRDTGGNWGRMVLEFTHFHVVAWLYIPHFHKS